MRSPFSEEFLGGYSSIASAYDVWDQELQDDVDRDYLLDGIKYGFHLTDSEAVLHPASFPNHKSTEDSRAAVEKELRSQIAAGHYVIASEPASIISPLAAIPKGTDGAVRLIHDGSRPKGESMNDYTTLHSIKYESLDDATRLAKPNYFMAKVDLKWAYRSVPIHPSDYKATRVQWHFEGDEHVAQFFDARVLPTNFDSLALSSPSFVVSNDSVQSTVLIKTPKNTSVCVGPTTLGQLMLKCRLRRSLISI